MTPCEMKRLMSGADHKTEYDFDETEQEMYSHRRHYTGYKVCLTVTTCGQSSSGYFISHNGYELKQFFKTLKLLFKLKFYF